MNKKTITWIIAIIIIIALIGVVGYGIIRKLTYKAENPIATITFEGYEEPIVVELYPKYALNTVKNFVTLANNGFYNGLTIHRIETYVIQGGDPEGTGSGGPKLSAIDSSIEKGSDADKEYAINGEFKANGYNNTLSHERGVLSMARSSYNTAELMGQSYNSAGSQFFICTENCPSFNGKYAAFGKMISGWDTLDKISSAELKVDVNEETKEETKTSAPKETIKMTSITVDTKGVDYGKPETHDTFDYSSWYMKKYYGGQYGS